MASRKHKIYAVLKRQYQLPSHHSRAVAYKCVRLDFAPNSRRNARAAMALFFRCCCICRFATAFFIGTRLIAAHAKKAAWSVCIDACTVAVLRGWIRKCCRRHALVSAVWNLHANRKGCDSIKETFTFPSKFDGKKRGKAWHNMLK